jgi:hypothetical protein
MGWEIFKLIGIILFLYLTWRNLRESYQEERLIAYSWLVLLMFLVGGRITFGVINWGVWNSSPIDWLSVWRYPGFNYWGGIVAILVTTGWYCKVNEWKLWSFFEDIIRIIYLLIAFILVDELIRTGFNLLIAAYLAVAIVGYLMASLMANRYRSLTWYKSGKKGFVFFFTNMVVSLLVAIVAVGFKEKLVVAGIFSVLSLVFMIGLFTLGGIFSNLLVFGQRRNSDKKG